MASPNRAVNLVTIRQPARLKGRTVMAGTAREPRGRAVAVRGVKVAPARPKPVARPLVAKELPADPELAACNDAADRCALVVAAFFKPKHLASETRGAAADAWPRQVWFAGLVHLGFEPKIVGQVVGRDKQTIVHACRIVEGIREKMEAPELVRLLGEDGCRDYLGGDDLVVEYRTIRGELICMADFEPDDRPDLKDLIVHVAEGGEAIEEFITGGADLIEEVFAAFRCVAVRGKAYCDERDRMKAERDERARSVSR